MRLLVIGDPEGRIRPETIGKLSSSYSPDLTVITGDLYSSPLTEHRFLRNRVLPAERLTEDLTGKKIVVYGNKDLNPDYYGLTAPKNMICTHKIYDEFELNGLKLAILNGSNVVEVGFSKKAEELAGEMRKILKKQKKKRISELEEKDVAHLKEKYGLTFSLVYTYPFTTNFKHLGKTDAKILATHTPPKLDKAELVEGIFPDYAVFKKTQEGIVPAHPKEKGAIKKHVGIDEISEFIRKSKNLKLVLCGHIHEASGLAVYGKTLVANPGSRAAYINKKGTLPHLLIETEDFTEIKYKLVNWDGISEGEITI
ncbi:MAG: hypothetical protein GXO63_02025 [Candidatus Micrarchaeota archaeon]|nr:hypothetical protein [Candidatus Micrarchaeota archaeon]